MKPHSSTRLSLELLSDPPPWAAPVLLGVLLVLGAALRVIPALETPVFVWDDAVVLLEATYLGEFVTGSVDAVMAKLEERRTGENTFRLTEAIEGFRDEATGIPPTFGRPAHDVAVLAVLSVLEWWAPARIAAAPALTSAIAGVLALPVFFVLGRRLYGPVGGWIAFSVLALSGAHVRYSRIGFSESLLVLVLGVMLLALERSRSNLRRPGREALGGALSVGIIGGLGMLVHFRFSILVGLIVLCEALHNVRRPPREASTHRIAMGRAARIAAGASLPLVAAELPYYFLLLLGRIRGIAFEVPTYAEQVVQVILPTGLGYAGSLVQFRPDNLLTYPFALLALGGLVLTAAAFSGLALSMRERFRIGPFPLVPPRPAPLDGTIVALFLVPLVFYSLSIPLLRYGATSFALAALLFARLGARLAERRERMAMPLVLMLVALSLLEGVVLTSLMIETRSGWSASLAAIERASSFGEPMTEHSERQMRAVLEGEDTGADAWMVVGLEEVPKHLSTMPPQSWALAGRESAEPMPATVPELATLVRSGHRYVLVDSLVDFLAVGDVGFPQRQALLRIIEERCTPLTEVANPAGGTVMHDLELNYRPFLETLELSRRADERRASTIRVYDLAACRAWRRP